jgi:putative transposase
VHCRKYKFHDNDKLYFISFATVYWIDVFVREEYNRIMIESFLHCQEKKGLEIYGWCIMPSPYTHDNRQQEKQIGRHCT